MEILNKKEPFVLFLGDVMFFIVSLWLMLLIRYLKLPGWLDFKDHLVPFSFLFFVWVSVFFIAGLYEERLLNSRRKLFSMILSSQIINTLIAIVFFYFVPIFGISPKTNLFIYLLVSFVFIVIWRIYLSPFLNFGKKQNALIIGSGKEMMDVKDVINESPGYKFKFVHVVNLDYINEINFEEILKIIKKDNISIVVADMEDSKLRSVLNKFYELVFLNVKFMSMVKIYQDIFDRVPLSATKYNWFLENISNSSNSVYDFLKRLMDIFISIVLGMISVIFYPFIIFAIKIDDGGPVFFVAERVGQNGKKINLLKFRTMGVSSRGDGIEEKPKITRVGAFLRRTRIDELPQILNVLRGELSLIGPRPEFPLLAKIYAEQISYYNARYLIKPGLSGWAQIYHKNHPHHGLDVEETKTKLSYDLYYIKNRSFVLDLKIALKTIKILLSRSGV